MGDFLEQNVGVQEPDINFSSADIESEPSFHSILTPRAPPQRSINLRDLGYLTDAVKSGVVWRSSQVINPDHIKELGIKTIIDLRGAPSKCKLQPRNLRQRVLRRTSNLRLWCTAHLKYLVRKTSAQIGLEDRSVHGGMNGLIGERQQLLLSGDESMQTAAPCWRCSQAFYRKFESNALVYHVNMLPGLIPLIIFAHLPCQLKLKVAYMALRKGKAGRPEPVVAAAIADPDTFGYTKLYIIILRKAKSAIAVTLKLLADEEAALPTLIHCQHGKDRTGLIVMLLYLLCDVPRELIVEDYARSESLLREARDNAELFGMDVEMTTDRIISSAKHVMEDTIEFLETRYGGVIQYLIRIGMTWEEIESLKKKLVSARPQL